jgi:hypothetical protein
VVACKHTHHFSNRNGTPTWLQPSETADSTGGDICRLCWPIAVPVATIKTFS